MNVKLVVSTMDGVFNEEYYPDGDYSVIVINQGAPFEKLILRPNVKVYNTSTLGLSKSRNIGLSQCQPGDIAVLTDNDVKFNQGFESLVRYAFISTDAEVLTFNVDDIEGRPFKKNYKNRTFKHDLFSLMRVSSIEIAVKVSKNLNLFDEDFGLGAKIPIGEENIFMADNIAMKAMYVPIRICKHNDDTHTGVIFNKLTFYYRWLVFKRVYGFFLGALIYFLFSIKNIGKYLRDGN